MIVRRLIRHFKCKKFHDAMMALSLETLDTKDSGDLHQHLAQCPDCRKKLVELKNLTGQLRAEGNALPVLQPPPELRARWRSAVFERAQPQVHAAQDRQVNAGKISIAGHLLQLIKRASPGSAWATGTVTCCWILIGLLHLSAPALSTHEVKGGPASWTEVRTVIEEFRSYDRAKNKTRAVQIQNKPQRGSMRYNSCYALLWSARFRNDVA